MPYVHVVVLKLRPEATDEQKANIVAELGALPAQIPEICRFRAGLDLGMDPSGCHVSVVATFESVDSYDVYANHPAHVKVISDHLKPVLEKRAAVQFVADDAPGYDIQTAPPPVTHAVLLKLKDTATPEQKRGIIAALRKLPTAISQIKGYQVGRDAGNDRAGFDVAIVGDFASTADYGTYSRHEKHVAVITNLIKPLLAERVAVQFSTAVEETGGPPHGLARAQPDVVPAGARSIELDVGRGTTLRGRVWGPEDGEPWLVLHGWLDNCASFDYLCPLLVGDDNKKKRLVCLDVAGHGHSSHRVRGSYTTADHVHDARMAALRLGWDRFSLMGHSMGGGICACLAGTIPDKIKRLVILEITGQGGSNPQHEPQMLGRTIHLLSVRHGLAQRSANKAGQGAPRTDAASSSTARPSADTTSTQEFEQAAATAKQLSSLKPKERLALYGLFKQAQAGPCNTPEPDDTTARYKHQAWKAHGEMSKQAAVRQYITLVKELQAKLDEGNEDQKDGASWAIPKPKFQYSAVSDAASLRAKSNFGGTLPMELSTSLCARALKPIFDPEQPGEPTPVGYSWRSDPALRHPMPGPRYTEEASREFANRISCPVLVLTAKNGMYTTSFRMQNKQKWWDNSEFRAL